MGNLTKTCTVGVLHFHNHCITIITDFLPSVVMFSSNLAIILDVVSSPKSVKNHSTHQNWHGGICYIIVMNNMFFFRDHVGAKKLTEFSAK